MQRTGGTGRNSGSYNAHICLARFSHQLSFVQMQGVRCAAVVIHRKRLTTQQLCKDRLAFMANKDKKYFSIYIYTLLKNSFLQLIHNSTNLTLFKTSFVLVREKCGLGRFSALVICFQDTSRSKKYPNP